MGIRHPLMIPNTALEVLKQDETDQQQTKYSTRNTETRSNRSTTTPIQH